MDNLKSSHINPKANNEILKWIKDMFGQLSEVKITQGLLHDYLGMTLDYSVQKEQAKTFHTMTTQGLFLCMHGCPDIAPAIAYLTTWAQKLNHIYWTKLCQML